ncbi:ATP-binding cassette domain-containing protein [Helicobacter ailurogastricus]|nr:ATP-binding cassette domain-containing protein [Helicobacter ailurogastricus]GLH60091.1 Excinuclease ABC subunit A UvrA [Helicobacter ailurogastricus]
MKIHNAYENNLKNIDLEIPPYKLVCFTGVSGSGKSSLIYQVIAREAQRREKIESGRAVLFDFAIKPKVDSITDLPYCEVLKQKGLQESISSSVASLSGLLELLRDEFVKEGNIISAQGKVIKEPSAREIIAFIDKFYHHKDYSLYAVLCLQKEGLLDKEIKLLKKYHVPSVFYYTQQKSLKERPLSYLEKLGHDCHSILIKVPNIHSLESYQELAVENFMLEDEQTTLHFQRDYFDLETGQLYQRKSAQLLSFNSISQESGRCLACQGRGVVDTLCADKLFNKHALSQPNFVNCPLSNSGYKYISLTFKDLQHVYKQHNIDTSKNFFDLPKTSQEILIEIFETKMQKHKGKAQINLFFHTVTCKQCKGTRLNDKANAVQLFGKNISAYLDLSVDALFTFLEGKKLHHPKIMEILWALRLGTLGYLQLKRTTDTLSGGELQRLKLANILQSKHNHLLYILDEPSSGLHPYDSSRVLHLIKQIVSSKNSVLMSEHNKTFVEESDLVVRLGPGAGKDGGHLIPTPTFQTSSTTRKKRQINSQKVIALKNVNCNNIIKQDFIFPLECLTAVSGVSGSGKTTLLREVLYTICKEYLIGGIYPAKLAEHVGGLRYLKHAILLNQSQIRAQSRSVVATFLDIFDIIRTLFASIEPHLDKSYFSFNHKNGQCPECKGLGENQQMLCPNCYGSGYQSAVLNVQCNGFNIATLLEQNIEDLMEFFDPQSNIANTLHILKQLKLSHLSLGRRTATLSGGEAQRLKLAKVLTKHDKLIQKGGVLLILDEPTAGLDPEDIACLYPILDRIIAYGNSVVCIEHNMDFIKNADFIIEMGKFAGKDGGKNIFSGSFQDLLHCNESMSAQAINGNRINIPTDIFTAHKQSPKTHHFDQAQYSVQKFLLNQEHFKIEKALAQHHTLKAEANHHYFKTKQDLIAFAQTLDIREIYINPFTTALFKYKKVPESLKKTYLSAFKSYPSIPSKNDWEYKIKMPSFEEAYSYGVGWIGVMNRKNTLLQLSTRLVSLRDQIIGSPIVDEAIFNIYLNACPYCHGTGFLYAYNLQ